MKALVTGGAGFIGVHLAHTLVGSHFEVTIFDSTPDKIGALADCPVRVVTEDLRNRLALQKELEGVDVVYHLAWSGIPSSSKSSIRANTENNLLSTLDLLDECRNAGVKRVVFMSSGGAIYGHAQQLPIPEHHPTVPISAYGAAKLSVEAHLSVYGHLYGLNYVTLRPSVPFGEWQNSRREQGAVNVFLQNVYCGRPIVIWGSGDIIRDFFYVGDLARACLLAANMDVVPGAYNIGGGVAVTLKELIERVRYVTGRAVPVIYEPPRSFDPPSIVLDISKARCALGWTPRVPLVDAIASTWAWITADGCVSPRPQYPKESSRKEYGLLGKL
jgi:UDP-glucose 4-epimerase